MSSTEGSADRSAVRAANRALNIAEFEAGAVSLASLPRVLFVELTENCNLSCPMCRSNGPFDRTKNMSPELFDRIARELFPTAEIVDLRGWGESTILRRFPEYLATTLDYGCTPRLVTNLTVPNEDVWRTLVRNRGFISVSLDAATQETLAVLRTGAKLQAILDNLAIIADEARVSGVGLDRVNLNVVVQQQGIGELTRIVALAAELGIAVHLNPLSTDENDPGNLRFHLDALRAALGDTAAFAQERGVDVRINAALDELWAEPEHAAKLCTHPWMYCYVNYRGQVGFCDHLIGAPGEEYLVGDLATASFAEIWNGSNYRELRASHRDWQDGPIARFDECNWCYRNRYVDFDEVSYPLYGRHIVPLTVASCAGFTRRPSA
ncbi:radical SAM protein [Solihabitans fulvus]|uniref:Radical SAM protein n=1 Tax=Solihabitans fulvus TaxID=1892852 RepID=A0A5B2XLD0_9PSEU|nr:radical SAM protein [Solihabitans fulvus]KAA2264183.1 radical SAM protein [Solihabitans fulvus]